MQWLTGSTAGCNSKLKQNQMLVWLLAHVLLYSQLSLCKHKTAACAQLQQV
jgi:hypothetical protein